MRLLNLATVVVVLAVAIAAPALADKGGHGHGGGGGGGGGNPTAPSSTCSVNPSSVNVDETYVVSASGLPTGVAINLWVTDPNNNTAGSPLGSTPDGTFNLNESSSFAGPWTYTFSGPTKNNPDTTSVYVSCSVTAS